MFNDCRRLHCKNLSLRPGNYYESEKLSLRGTHARLPCADRKAKSPAQRLYHRHGRLGARPSSPSGHRNPARQLARSLHGIPLGIKDFIDTAGTRTTAASELFKDRIPTEDAEVVSQLKNAGAVLLGKQNLHEFAYGGSSLVSYYGDVRNPWNTAHIAGGSSGGSAAAVAAGMCFGAIGTDTAGSIREPAALCGVVGLKPTYGRVSAQGVIPLSSSLDHLGPIARTVEDAAIVFQAIASMHEPREAARFDTSSLDKSSAHFRIGVPRKFFFEDLDPEINAAVEQAILETPNTRQ